MNQEKILSRVVIIGGGFAGLTLMKKLRNKNFEVWLLDKNNYHTFQPLLYQVAMGGLSPDNIAYPFRRIIKRAKNIHFRMTEVNRVDPSNQIVSTESGEYSYDYLVIATGSTTNFFGLKNLEENGMQLKSIPQALDIRSDVLQEFEKALLLTDEEKRKRHLSFVIVGAGPTGVELAGALAEFKKTIVHRDYPEINRNLMQVHLIEAMDRVLPSMSSHASKYALKYLNNLGVHNLLNTRVEHFDGENLILSNGESLKTDSIIWTAGVKGIVVEGLNQSIVEGNRFGVNEYCRVKGYENVFALGDVAFMKTEKYPRGLPMLGASATQQGHYLAHNLIRLQKRKTLKPFRYSDKGTMATVGRYMAVVDFRFIHLHGSFAWFIWMSLHLMLLVGFRNKLVTFVNWAYNFFNYERAIRLIVRPYSRTGGKPFDSK